ncbi:hypothetical protein MRB53_041358 [Persea americana]|nr:hypothetical protein MRB53_041358 [Persea americana]
MHASPTEALALWGKPESHDDISSLFRRYLDGELAAIPWSEEPLSSETSLIRTNLLKLAKKGWWSVASQPAVNACHSSDETFGWGPRVGGFVWQKVCVALKCCSLLTNVKPFVEFFVPASDWKALRERLDSSPDQVTYFAGNARGDFMSSDEESVNPVTWGAFKGKEIITPTIIEAVSFKAWLEEAFTIWRDWARVHPASSKAAHVLTAAQQDVWLVNAIGHDYFSDEEFWSLLLES